MAAIVAAQLGRTVVLVDRVQIETVIHSLVHNAIEAHTERGPVIKRRFEDEAEEDPPKDDPNKIPSIMVLVGQSDAAIHIQIRDNGPGIPKDLQEKVWDPYFTTKTPPHTGAGLHLARAIVRAAAASVTASSAWSPRSRMNSWRWTGSG